MLLLIWPRYDDEDTHDGGIDYSGYGRAPESVKKQKKAPKAAEVIKIIESKAEDFEAEAFERGRAEVAEFYRAIQEITQELDSLEARAEFLRNLEEITRILFEEEQARIAEEEEILAFLLCQ